MSQWTSGDIAAETARLELAAATLLGQAIFEFGHLEMELALFLVWPDEGRQLEALTAFQRWLKRAHDARLQRNDFVHGRWGVAATTGQVINVIGNVRSVSTYFRTAAGPH